MISRILSNKVLSLRLFSSTAATYSDAVVESGKLSKEEIWKRRSQLAKPTIQRFEKPSSKFYYAPEWDITETEKKDEVYSPLKRCLTTPQKWEYYNKVVWPVNYIVPETGLPKPVEVFHCEESFRFSSKKMWYACQFIWRMTVDDALLQLKFKNTKASLILTSVIEKAKERATKEFHIDNPGKMFIAESFPIQCKIVKSLRRHARENWNKRRHRYIHVFVRLEEGEGPGYNKREPPKSGWNHMEAYYDYLRNREIKMLN